MQEIQYREILDSVSDWVWAVDAEGVYTYCSENVYNYLGFHSHEVVGKTPFDFMSEEEALRVGKIFSHYSSRNEKIVELENIHLHKNGKEVVVVTTGIPILDIEGKLLAYQGIDRDITKQKELFRDIKKQNSAFEMLFEQSPYGVIIIQNNIFVQCNQEIVRILNYTSKEELLNVHPSKISPEFQPDGRDSYLKAEEMMALAVKNQGHSFEWIHTRANGEDFLAEIVLTPISLADRDVIHVILRDISQQREAEKNIQEKQAILIQQARYASMGEMIANIAHQWRQPLSALGLIIQKNELLYRHNKLDDKSLEENMNKSMKLIDKMSTTIDDFRGFFNTKDRDKYFLLSDAIEQAYSIVEGTLAQESIEYSLKIDDDNIKIKGHENEISQVIVNLLNNAKDAILENSISNPIITVHLKKKNNTVTVDVSDNAKGIADEILPKIFDPYFSTKMESHGTGIGLYMSKMIIEDKMNGKLSVKSTENGSTFTLMFDTK